MKLDVNVLRYLSKEDFRVLTAVEMGQKNHEIVPVQLIDSISGLKHGGAYRCLKTLLQHKLVHHESAKYDGYRLTYMGYDFLAIKTLTQRGHICGVGRQIGVGKESDIFEVTNEEGEVFALKLHRLGRTSFRDVKSKRDYLGRRNNYSWLYLSRLAALKEYAFMKALGDHGFPVPEAIDQNRHAVLMALVDAQPLVQVRRLAHPGRVYASAMDLISRLAAKGLVHCDFNEFNLLVDEGEELTVIDFPQMVSVSHPNAQELFDRDVDCIIRFFTKKIGYMPQQDPDLPSIRPSFEAAAAEAAAAGASGLDVELAASGFQKQHADTLDRFLHASSEEVEGSGGEEGEQPEGSSGYGSGSDEDEEGPQEGPAASSGSEEEGQEERVGRGAGVSSSSSSRQQAAGAGLGPGSTAAAAAAAEAAAVGQRLAGVHLTQQQQQQQQQEGQEVCTSHSLPDGAADVQDGCSSSGVEGSGSEGEGEDVWEGVPSSSRGAVTVDMSHKSREVQQRLVAQRQRAAATARAAKAGKNVSKARGKKAQQTAAALRECGAYPYDKPSSHPAADQASTTSSFRPAAEGHSTRMTEARTSRNVMESMQRLMRSWPGMKQLFEVAVKRNSLTTSLVLLSSVLVADTLLVDQSQLKHFNLRARLGQDHVRAHTQQHQQQQSEQQHHHEQQHHGLQEQHFAVHHHDHHHQEHHHGTAAAAAAAGVAPAR